MVYLEIIVAHSLLVKVPDFEPSASFERLRLNNFLDLCWSVRNRSWSTALLSSASLPPFAPCNLISAHGAENSLLSAATVDRGVVSELWKSECESLGAM